MLRNFYTFRLFHWLDVWIDVMELQLRDLDLGKIDHENGNISISQTITQRNLFRHLKFVNGYQVSRIA